MGYSFKRLLRLQLLILFKITKPNKIWVDKSRGLYNRSIKSWLEKNDTGMYPTHNEGKSVVTERLIRTLKNEFYPCITSISKYVYIDKLDGISQHIYHTTTHNTAQ